MIKVGYTTSDGVDTIHETVSTGGQPAADTAIRALRQSKATQNNILYFFLAYELEGNDIQYVWLDPL
jgi:hypothetical protein